MPRHLIGDSLKQMFSKLFIFNLFRFPSRNPSVLSKFKPVDFQVYLDASLSGLDGVFCPSVYALPLGTDFQHLHIVQLEMLNVVVAL